VFSLQVREELARILKYDDWTFSDKIGTSIGLWSCISAKCTCSRVPPRGAAVVGCLLQRRSCWHAACGSGRSHLWPLCPVLQPCLHHHRRWAQAGARQYHYTTRGSPLTRGMYACMCVFVPFLQPMVDDSWQISGRFFDITGLCCSVEFYDHVVALCNLPSSIPLDSSIG
jgi:hypothetical protein